MGYPTIMFERRTYLVIESKLHTIFFQIAQGKRGGEFEQGYERFMESLEIIP
jgi:hypothetical protein